MRAARLGGEGVGDTARTHAGERGARRAASGQVRVDPAPQAPPAARGLDGLVQRAMAEVVPVTFSFTPAPRPEVQSVTIRFTGRRLDVDGRAGPADRFVHDETFHGILAGSGPIAVTAKVRGVNPGDWEVTAKMVPPRSTRQGRSPRAPQRHVPPQPVRLAGWSWLRWRLVEPGSETVRACPEPFVRAPAVLVGSWTILSFLGIVVGLVSQALLSTAQDLRLAAVLPVSLAALFAGLVGAKLWYLALHRSDGQRNGWCIQGLVVGIAVVAPLLLATTDTPIGTFFDVSTPGLLFGMAIGRLGCFFTGCCCGRPTASRWGVWSSSRRPIGARRVPTQLMESFWTAAVGAGTLAGVLGRGAAGGAWFVGGLALYTLGRQGTLLFREEPKSRRGALLTAVVAGLVVVAAALVV